MIDNNGYIVISERENDTGKFFGEVEGAILETLVNLSVYKVLTVYDYQALCGEEVEVVNDGTLLMTVTQEPI